MEHFIRCKLVQVCPHICPTLISRTKCTRNRDYLPCFLTQHTITGWKLRFPRGVCYQLISSTKHSWNSISLTHHALTHDTNTHEFKKRKEEELRRPNTIFTTDTYRHRKENGECPCFPKSTINFREQYFQEQGESFTSSTSTEIGSGGAVEKVKEVVPNRVEVCQQVTYARTFNVRTLKIVAGIQTLARENWSSLVGHYSTNEEEELWTAVNKNL